MESINNPASSRRLLQRCQTQQKGAGVVLPLAVVSPGKRQTKMSRRRGRQQEW